MLLVPNVVLTLFMDIQNSTAKGGRHASRAERFCKRCPGKSIKRPAEVKAECSPSYTLRTGFASALGVNTDSRQAQLIPDCIAITACTEDSFVNRASRDVSVLGFIG